MPIPTTSSGDTTSSVRNAWVGLNTKEGRAARRSPEGKAARKSGPKNYAGQTQAEAEHNWPEGSRQQHEAMVTHGLEPGRGGPGWKPDEVWRPPHPLNEAQFTGGSWDPEQSTKHRADLPKS